ncbi:MAG: four helix bundle protein [Candidatus Portnoybacteria bacterium]|nr:four helix bundle protein [Candidatus Portnoybacteria bacterium]
MREIPNSKRYDLEERCLEFAGRVNEYVRKLPKDIPNIENGRQLVRSAGSIGANYIEANESLSKKDFAVRAKISKKEAKETRYWLHLTIPDSKRLEEKKALIQEATELMHIFGAILEKTK